MTFILQRVALVTSTVGALLAVTAAALAAYGPSPPPGPPVPGGFSVVIATKTIGSAGGQLVAKSGGTRFVLTVRRGVLKRPVQFTLTKPGRLKVAPSSVRFVLGFGVQANLPTGKAITGSFGRTPIPITVSSRLIAKNSFMAAWSPTRHRFVRVSATVHKGTVTVRTRHFAEFLILAPKS